MQWQFPGKNVREVAMFQAEQTDSTSVILRGHWLLWDPTDNTAVAGILDETRGYRVILAAEALSNRVAGCVEVAPAVTGTNLAASQRMPPFTIQVYGYHSAAYIKSTAAGCAIGKGLCMSSTAGKAVDIITTDHAAVGGVQIIGCPLATVTGAQDTTFAVFVRCLG